MCPSLIEHNHSVGTKPSIRFSLNFKGSNLIHTAYTNTILVTVLMHLLVCPPAFRDSGKENPLSSPTVSQDSASLVYHWWLLNREPAG